MLYLLGGLVLSDPDVAMKSFEILCMKGIILMKHTVFNPSETVDVVYKPPLCFSNSYLSDIIETVSC